MKTTIISLVAAGLLVATAPDVLAADDTWTGKTATSGQYLWQSSGNWDTSTPSSNDTAIFDASAQNKIVTINSNIGSVAAMDFTTGGYTINLTDTGVLSTGEINLNASGTTVFSGSGTVNAGEINFNASGATLTVSDTDSGDGLNINGAGVTGNGTITIENTGGLAFSNSSTAGDATINITSGSFLSFNNSSNAGNATINNNGGDCTVDFSRDSTAGNATINSSGDVVFSDSSSAENATITNNSNTSSIEFLVDSNAGNATIINNGGRVRFLEGYINFSDIGTPNIINNSGSVDFTFLSGKTLTLNSLAGDGGTIEVGFNELQVGAGNTDTVFDGDITSTDHSITGINSDPTAPAFSFDKVGTGSLTLNGSGNIFALGANVADGTLIIGDASHTSASVTGDVTVASGGALGGSGTVIGNITVNSGGSISAIDANNPLTVNGAITFNSGSNLNFTRLSSFVSGQKYTLLTASGGIAGTQPTDITSPFVTANITINSNNIQYILTLNASSIDTAPQTANQHALANYIIANGNSSAMGTVSGAVGHTSSDPQLRTLLDQLSGATFANQSVALAGIGNWFDIQVDTHTPTMNPLPGGDPSFWVATQDGYNQLSSSSDASGINTHLHGVAVGGDLALSDKTTVGAAFGLTNFNESASDQEIASANGDLYQLGAYIHHAIKNWRLGAELSYGFTDSVDTKRTISIENAQTTGSYHANIWSARGDVGYALPLASSIYHVQPFAGMITQRVNQDGFTENSNTGFELHVDDSTYQSVRSQLGVNADATPFANMPVDFFGNLSWEHEFADTRGEFTANFVGVNNSFNVDGTDIGRDAAVIGAGVKVPVHHNMFDITASYQGRFASNLRENLGLLQAAYNF